MTSMNTKRFEDVRPGEQLPELTIPITVGLIAGGAIATRDYFPGHHDLDAARELGSPHIFMNILTTNGLVQRFIEQWSGPQVQFRTLKIKLGAPNYPGDSMTLSGEVTHQDAATRSLEVTLKGKNSMGNHVTGTVALVLLDPRETTQMTNSSISGRAAIAGLGATEFSKNSGRTELRLAMEATLAALEDAGIDPGEVEGFSSYSVDKVPEYEIARLLGCKDVKFFSQVPHGGGAACGPVMHAAMAVATGVAKVVVVYRAMNERSWYASVPAAMALPRRRPSRT